MAQSDKNVLVTSPLIEGKERTLGDGMDSSLLKLTTEANFKTQIRLTSKPINTFKPVYPQSKAFNLVPKYIPNERKHPKCLIRKPKEPKFVPYEPYKGAVEPIKPKKTVPVPPIKLQVKPSKNNVEIQELVEQMSEMRAAELNKANKEAVQNEDLIPKKEWEKQKGAYETDIKNLRESNSHLENQLKFQAQVNSELKTLLVAAVGEDLESRVQHLTEDKLQLARALLKSADHLTSHQEQTEWLSGQCEVWRSKFLASSLMVEELARWKSALSSRVKDLQESVQALLDEHKKMQKNAQKTFVYLNNALQKSTEAEPEDVIQPATLKHAHIVDLCDSNCKMSKKLGRIIGIDEEDCNSTLAWCTKLDLYTASETNAMKLLQNSVTISDNQDALCSALMGSASSLGGGGQKFLQYPSNHSTCCAHCKGAMEHI